MQRFAHEQLRLSKWDCYTLLRYMSKEPETSSKLAHVWHIRMMMMARISAILAALVFLAAPAQAQIVYGSGLPSPVVNGECIIGAGGVAVWGSCSGAGTSVTSVTGTAGQITASPTTGDVILTLPATITEVLTFSGANAYGTPASITLTNGTGLPVAGLSNLGANVGTFLITPSSANLASALTDETGSGLAVFNTNPTLAGATLSGTLALGTQTVSGGFTMSGVPILSGLSAGTQTKCLGLDSGNHVVYVASACGSGSGSGTVTSVAASVPASSILGISGSPITTSGTLGLTTTGTSGGVPYFFDGNTLKTSAALTANLPMIGGGAGAAPSVGTRSGNTTAFVTTTGAQTSGKCVTIDANGNHVADSAACGGGGSLTVTDGTNSVASTTTLTVGNGFLVGGSAGSATLDATNTLNTQSGTGAYAILATDAGLQVVRTNASGGADTIAAASTTNFTAGYSTMYTANGQAGNTITPASGTIGGLSVLKLGKNQSVSLDSDGTNYNVAASVPIPATQTGSTVLKDDMTWATFGTAGAAATGTSGHTLGFLDGANTISGVQTFTNSDLKMLGSSTGATTFTSANAGGSNFTLTFPARTANVATSSGTLTNGNCVSIDASGNFVDAGGACTTGGGGGTVNSGTSGQLAYYASSTNAVSGNADANISAGVLSLGVNTSVLGSLKMFGNTSGDLTLTPPAVAGTASKITFPVGITDFSGTSGFVQQATTGAAFTVAALPAASTSTAGIAKLHNVPLSVGWIATVNPNKAIIATVHQASRISAIIGRVSDATGTTATVAVYKAASGTACSAGTILHSGTLDANGTANTNQTLTLVGGATDDLADGDSLCLVTTGTTAWTGGTGIGSVSVYLAPI